jgi:hypothetical protein
VTIENSYPGPSATASATFPEFQFLSGHSYFLADNKIDLETKTEKHSVDE